MIICLYYFLYVSLLLNPRMGVIKTAFGLSIIRALIALFLKTYIVEITFEKRKKNKK